MTLRNTNSYGDQAIIRQASRQVLVRVIILFFYIVFLNFNINPNPDYGIEFPNSYAITLNGSYFLFRVLNYLYL